MMIQKKAKSLYVALGSEMAIYRFPQLSSSEKLEELSKPNGFVYFKVDDLKSASQLCRDFISEFNLGASNWIGGRVVDENFDFIAWVSYNGRVWDDENWSIAKEIQIC